MRILYKESIILTLEALISEYLLWVLLPILFLVKIFKDKVQNAKAINKLLLIGGFSSLIYFLGPTDFTRVNITSNMRFLQVPFIILILAVFLLAKKFKREKEIVILSILSSVAVLAQFSYYPKLIIIWLAMILILLLKKSHKYGYVV